MTLYNIDNNIKRKYSPSRLELLERCPRFWQDNSKPNEAAERGTRLHKATETNNPDMIADPQDREQVLTCMLHKQMLDKEFPEAETHDEMRLQSSLTRGTADRVYLDFKNRTGVVLDYKYGKERVTDPERNIQFWSYDYCLMAEYAEIDKVHTVVSQPQVSEDMIRAVITRSQIQDIRSRIEQIIARAEDPNAEPTPDDKACKYCDRKASCKALKAIAFDTFTKQYGMVIPQNVMLGIDHSVETVGQVHAFFTLLEDLAKQGKKQSNERADELQRNGEGVPEGYSLVRKAGNWKVKDAYALFCMLTDNGVPVDRVIKECYSAKAKAAAELQFDILGKGINEYLDEMQKLGVMEQGDESVYLRKKPKTDLMKKLQGK